MHVGGWWRKTICLPVLFVAAGVWLVLPVEGHMLLLLTS